MYHLLHWLACATTVTERTAARYCRCLWFVACWLHTQYAHRVAINARAPCRTLCCNIRGYTVRQRYLLALLLRLPAPWITARIAPPLPPNARLRFVIACLVGRW